MALQASGAINLAQVQGEFGGSNPISLNEYYRNGVYVPSTQGVIPTSGAISMQQFYGTENRTVPIVSYLGGASSASGTYSVSASSRRNRIAIIVAGTSASSAAWSSAVINGTAATRINGGSNTGWEQALVAYRTINVGDTSVSISISAGGAVSYVHRVYIIEDLNSLTPYHTATGNSTFTAKAGDIAFVSLANDDSVGTPSATLNGAGWTYDASTTVTNMTYRCGDAVLIEGSNTINMSAQDRLAVAWN